MNRRSSRRVTQKRVGHQDDCPDRHWGRGRQLSTSPVTTRAVTLTAFMTYTCLHVEAE